MKRIWFLRRRCPLSDCCSVITCWLHNPPFWHLSTEAKFYICKFSCFLTLGIDILSLIIVVSFVSSDRSSYSDGGLIYIDTVTFLRFWAFLPIHLVFLFENWMHIDNNWFHDFSVLFQPLFLNFIKTHIFRVLSPNRPYQELNTNLKLLWICSKNSHFHSK